MILILKEKETLDFIADAIVSADFNFFGGYNFAHLAGHVQQIKTIIGQYRALRFVITDFWWKNRPSVSRRAELSFFTTCTLHKSWSDIIVTLSFTLGYNYQKFRSFSNISSSVNQHQSPLDFDFQSSSKRVCSIFFRKNAWTDLTNTLESGEHYKLFCAIPIQEQTPFAILWLFGSHSIKYFAKLGALLPNCVL